MNHAYDVSHFLAGLMLVVSFALLYQDRIFAVLNVFATQAIVLAIAVGWEAWMQQRPHLFITAALALCLKGIVIPMALPSDDRAPRRSSRCGTGGQASADDAARPGPHFPVADAGSQVTVAAESFAREGLAWRSPSFFSEC